MGNDVRKRFRWVQLFQELKNCTRVCLKCGISRPTLRKWVRRYEEQGLAGLADESRRPNTSPAARISDIERQWIAELRVRGLGSRRIQSELKRSHNFDISRPTIEKVLKTMKPRPRVVRPPARKGSRRYAKEIPGERVQMDTCKIAPGLYQYTAIDDCTRIRVLALYKRRTASNSLEFLELAIEEFPFPIQCIQTDPAGSFSPTAFRKS